MVNMISLLYRVLYTVYCIRMRYLGVFFFLYRAVSVVKASIVIAASCVDGVIIGTDSLSSIGGKQTLIQNRNFESVFPIDSNTCLCYAAGDFAFYKLRDALRTILTEYRLENGDGRGLGAESIAHITRGLIHSKYRDAHAIIVGQDANDEFYIYEIIPGGTRVKQSLAVAGSGAASTSLVASLLFQEKSTVEEGIAKMRQVLRSSVGADHRTKGRMKLWSLTTSGLKRVEEVDITEPSSFV